MALRSEEDWNAFFVHSGIPNDAAALYAKNFVDNRITGDLLPSMDRQFLKDLDITVIGDVMKVLQHASTQTFHPNTPDSTSPRMPSSTGSSASHKSAKLPSITSEMTHPQFRKFRIDWTVYKQIAGVPTQQVPSLLYNTCDDSTQNNIINTIPNFLTFSEDQLLQEIETIVTQKANPTVYRMKFSAISQHENELVRDYLVRLKSSAQDCEFACPSCQHDLSPSYIRDQLIRGLHNETLQVDILAKATQLKTMEDVIKHADAFESALRDHAHLQDTNEVMAARTSQYKRQFKAPARATPCTGCGSSSHSSRDRSTKCPAWGKHCKNCNTLNHFANVCRKKTYESAEVLLAHISYNQKRRLYTNTSEITEIDIELTAHSKKTSPQANMKVFPDSGASICLAGPQHLHKLRLSRNSLIPCRKQVRAVGGSMLVCSGWLPMTFAIQQHSTKQPLYICEKVDRIYLSRKACTDLNILPGTFPFPMDQPTTILSIEPECPPILPSKPTKLPYKPTEKNIPKLKQYLLDQFANTTFNTEGLFPTMETKPAHIHINDEATPYVRHTPIPVPFHLKEAVKNSLDNDVRRGIITPVPIGTPVEWCTTMVITPKKNGKIRRTIDLQHLNRQCKRETHHCPSPFQLACQVPPNTKKTVFDAVDGYHAIPLDDESQHYTTFITEWGRYRYLRMPQGFKASGDAYTSRYDEVIKDVPRKVKCVDDALLYDIDIETSFFRAWDYLALCWEKGIVLNSEKFQFCLDDVTFAGLRITSTGIAPSEVLLSSIRDFPVPNDITDARSWFGLVNQVAWAYSISSIMQPFRSLVKRNNKFYWDETLDQLFQDSKRTLISTVEDGIRAFDYQHTTCLQTDWSKEGIGYLLLQKHCQCTEGTAPICCPDGWKLIYAGSRFTTETESRYAPTEGEALAVAWSLEHAKMFVLGCKDLIVTTDHKPLLGIFNDRDLGSIYNPRIQKLKSRTLRFRFTTQYCPGKWLRGPDALSRNPSTIASVEPLHLTLQAVRQQPSATEISQSSHLDIDGTINAMTAINSFQDTNHHVQLITLDRIRQCTITDTLYTSLLTTILNGFPTNRASLPADLRPFWEVRQRLSEWEGIAMLDSRLIIPSKLRQQVLQSLHSAHQGCTGMQSRASESIYWPGLNRDIHQIRDNCKTCITHSPSQSKEPIVLSPSPQYPFQMVTADYFVVSGHHYLTVVDRYSGWICVYHFKNEATSSTLISVCRTLFTTYGVPEEFGSDGGPQLTAATFQTFLANWGVHHRLSSAEYPQSNGRAELGVKAAKRIVYDNVPPRGSIDNDKVARAILQYRNTPLPNLKLSPAQILFHRQLRDHIPTHPSHYRLHQSWLISAEQREEAYVKRNHIIAESYNSHSKPLPKLPIGATVLIQNRGKKRPRQWFRTGRIVETLPNRQYQIRMDGSGRLTLQNRRFIRPATYIQPPMIPSAEVPVIPPQSTTNPPNVSALPHQTSSATASPAPPPPSPALPTPDQPSVSNILRRLASHNAPGRLEQQRLEPRR